MSTIHSSWVHTPGSQAYAVLTVPGAVSIEEGGQISERAAAFWAAAALPDRADLVNRAGRWWYEAGTDAEPGRLPEVTRFAGGRSHRPRAAADVMAPAEIDRVPVPVRTSARWGEGGCGPALPPITHSAHHRLARPHIPSNRRHSARWTIRGPR